MDFQVLFDIALGLAGAFGGWVLKMMYDKINGLDKDLFEQSKSFQSLVEKLPDTYARRDDVKDKFDQLLAACVRIEGKIDTKNG